ncbi:DUF58 domain-containing protein [Planctomicrobium sp. SH668]|uniref:DUF58 domain-containing protein n=1 Tax=Planctomicrobium sp. SH668 TaxID=3448126 RepID=UPI003F5B01AF
MSSPPMQDPTALAKFGQLEVVVRMIVEGLMMGHHRSPFKGSSVEFVEHRHYYPGDEIRHIDWRAVGKTGKYYVKEYEEETNFHAYLVVDASGSMGFSASTLSKFDYARLLAASLGYLMFSQRDAVGLVTFDSAVKERVEPSTNMKMFRSISASLANTQPGSETSLATVLNSLIPTLKRRSVVFLISDFFCDVTQLETVLQRFRRARHEVILMQVIAPEEVDFPFEKPTQFRSLELDSHRLLVDPHRLRQLYLKQFQEFQTKLRSVAVGCGFDFFSATTADPFEKVLGEYLSWRTRRAKTRQ